MLRRSPFSLFAVGFFAALLVGAVPLFAQPVPASAPEKPVPVREEPFHQVAFENAFVRVIDVHFPPGKATLFHIHTIPSVVVELTDATIVSQEWGAAPPAPRHVVPGEARYAPYDQKPLTHRVTNVGQTVFHVLDIALLHTPSETGTTPVQPPPGAKLAWEETLARLYQLSVAPKMQIAVPPSECAHLLIAATGSVQLTDPALTTAPVRALKAGAYLYFPPRQGVSLSNPDGTAATCVLLELK